MSPTHYPQHWNIQNICKNLDCSIDSTCIACSCITAYFQSSVLYIHNILKDCALVLFGQPPLKRDIEQHLKDDLTLSRHHGSSLTLQVAQFFE